MRTSTIILSAFIGVFISACDQHDVPPNGTVEIITNPGYAMIFVDDSYRGNTPKDSSLSLVIELPVGEHHIIARVPTDEPEEYYISKYITVTEHSLQTLDLSLYKHPSDVFRSKLLAKYLYAIPQPEMVTIPGGSFYMGCVSGKDCDSDEKPAHKVTVPAFEMSKYEITYTQWDACVAMGGCDHYPRDHGWGRGNRPVTNISWDDIQEYIYWLNQETGQDYRLPSEAEWEYAARAGSNTKYSWGNDIGSNRANCDGCGSPWDFQKTAPVDAFSANDFRLYNMHGNVSEWVQDCWSEDYRGKPTDGSAWEIANCEDRVIRGGAWFLSPVDLRSASRDFDWHFHRLNNTHGFRLARSRKY